MKFIKAGCLAKKVPDLCHYKYAKGKPCCYFCDFYEKCILSHQKAQHIKGPVPCNVELFKEVNETDSISVHQVKCDYIIF